MLDAVVISGGEPTIQKDLKAFIIKIKDMGFKVKLDTNGYKGVYVSNYLPCVEFIYDREYFIDNKDEIILTVEEAIKAVSDTSKIDEKISALQERIS